METVIKEAVFWFVWRGLVAIGSASLVWVIMQTRIRLLARKHKAALTRLVVRQELAIGEERMIGADGYWDPSDRPLMPSA